MFLAGITGFRCHFEHGRNLWEVHLGQVAAGGLVISPTQSLSVCWTTTWRSSASLLPSSYLWPPSRLLRGSDSQKTESRPSRRDRGIFPKISSACGKNMGKTPRSGKDASSSGPSSTAAAAGGYSHHQKASSSQKVSSTIASMLNELSTLVRQTQVGWALIGIVGLSLCLWYRVRERPANRLWQTLQRHTIE